jgi:hypothetical protein
MHSAFVLLYTGFDPATAPALQGLRPPPPQQHRASSDRPLRPTPPQVLLSFDEFAPAAATDGSPLAW